MKIAAQLYTVKDFCKDWDGISKTLEKIALIGYKSIQVSCFGQFEPIKLKNKADETGLEICVTHTPFARITGETDKVIEEHILYGAKYVGLGTYDVSNLEKCKKFLDEILPCTDKIYNAGLKFVYHNHAIEFNRMENGKTPIEYIVENTQVEKFGFLADLYWVQFAGKSPVDFLYEYKNRLDIVHLKDMKITDYTKNTLTEIFEGNMDYLKIIKTCQDIGIKYAAVEQDICQGDPFESLKISLENIKKHCFYLF